VPWIVGSLGPAQQVNNTFPSNNAHEHAQNMNMDPSASCSAPRLDSYLGRLVRHHNILGT